MCTTGFFLNIANTTIGWSVIRRCAARSHSACNWQFGHPGFPIVHGSIIAVRYARSTTSSISTTSLPSLEKKPFVFQVAGIAEKYTPRAFERKWYEKCLHAGLFSPTAATTITSGGLNCQQQKFSMMLPPPNVTGSLHMGHVLTVAVQDSIARHRRKRGYSVNWLPGLDHAGIATQVQVEKHLLATRGLQRLDLSRTDFVQECVTWKDARAQQIIQQLQRVGASLNWSQLSFTLDPGIVDAVQRIFIQLYERGYIYRDKLMVMHCPHLRSTVSDIEVDWLETDHEQEISVPSYPDGVASVGYMLHFAYPLINNSRDEIVVATTRPETMLGDVAIAVHPNDSRYSHLVGQSVQHPFISSKILPIIADAEFVDPQFGSGAVKITPAHDFNDYALALKHGLPIGKPVIDETGTIQCSACAEVDGQNRFRVRQQVERMLAERGLLRQHQRDNIRTRVPLCSRSRDIVEPMLKDQWFLSTEKLQEAAVNAVNYNQLQFTPPFFANVFRNWLQQRHDWCLSRQLWWGIQIPAYKVYSVNNSSTPLWVCAADETDARNKVAKQHSLQQSDILRVQRDADVLDTWFSSGCLPFLHGATAKDKLPDTFPLSLMETGHDIIFFWVARMVMMSLACTSQLPFQHVLLHGMLCDEHGKKMTKSKGNVVDPMQILCDFDNDNNEKTPSSSSFAFDIGADAMRFALLRHDNLAVKIDFDVQHDIESANKFCNKIWQSIRYMLAAWNDAAADSTNDGGENSSRCDILSIKEILSHAATSPLDAWVLGRLQHTFAIVDDVLSNTYQMQSATEALYKFWLEIVCDIYIECIKPYVRAPSVDADAENEQQSGYLQSAFAVAARGKNDNSFERKQIILSVLYHTAVNFMHMMHPFMPFITDELYEQISKAALFNEKDAAADISLCVSPYPTLPTAELGKSTLDAASEIFQSCVRELRSLKGRYNVLHAQIPARLVYCSSNSNNEDEMAIVEALHTELCILTRSPRVQFIKVQQQTSEEKTSLADVVAAEASLQQGDVVSGISTHSLYAVINLSGFIDFAREFERVAKKHDKLALMLQKMNKKTKAIERKRIFLLSQQQLNKNSADEQQHDDEWQELEAKRAQIAEQLHMLADMKEQLRRNSHNNNNSNMSGNNNNNQQTATTAL